MKIVTFEMTDEEHTKLLALAVARKTTPEGALRGFLRACQPGGSGWTHPATKPPAKPLPKPVPMAEVSRAFFRQALTHARKGRTKYKRLLAELVQNLPRCDERTCRAPATHALKKGGGGQWCSSHAPKGSACFPQATIVQKATEVLSRTAPP